MVEKHETRLLPLDAIRGVAALAVAAFSHYENFGGKRENYPYMSLWLPRFLYGHAWLAVDLFFLISGVVLTFRYLEPLRDRRIAARDFFFLRLSRLYPLHLVTLLVCAAVEWTLLAEGKPTVIYPSGHDLYHLVLHLTYLHSGWFDLQWSYNMPTWSVCSEVFAYVVFFVLARRYREHYGVACVAAIFVGMVGQTSKIPPPIPIFNPFIGRALVGFFTGSLVLFAIQYFDRIGKGRAFGLASLGVFTALAALGALLGFDAWVGSWPPSCVLAIFPPFLVAALRVRPLSYLLSIRPLLFLGDISYAVYLVHIPLQMVVLFVVHARNTEVPAEASWVLFAYVGAVVALATLAHYTIERPAQRWLRSRLHAGYAAASSSRA